MRPNFSTFHSLYLCVARRNLFTAFVFSQNLRWLDTVFQGQYLPSLSTNYVAINKAAGKRFCKNGSQCRDILLQVKKVIESLRCYDNSDVVATLIISNFHLYLIQLWWQFFQIFVYGDVVYAQTWEVLTLKNSIEPP